MIDHLRICVVADMHGQLPIIPPCDVLILSGDIAPDFGRIGDPSNTYRQTHWLNSEFARWLDGLPAEEIIATGGNHDFAIHRQRASISTEIRWQLLIDEPYEAFGLKFWGSPWVINLSGWAFNLSDEQAARKWARIPDDTDILVLHGPPHGFGDAVGGGFSGVSHVGSRTILPELDRVRPKLVTYGHIHEGRGQWRRGDSLLVNASVLDEHYRMRHQPWVKRLDEITASGVASSVQGG